MKNFVLSLGLMALPVLALAQNRYFTVYKDQNRLEFPQCKSNHNVILRAYKNQLDSQINRLVVGIEQEQTLRTPKKKIDAYYHLLLQATVKRIVLEEMILQLERFDLDSFRSNKGQQKLVFNTDLFIKDPQERIGKSLRAALKHKGRDEMSDYVVGTIKSKLLSGLATQTGEFLVKSLSGKLVANFSASAIKGATISIGSKALVGSLRGGLLTLLTVPLMGSRLPPTKEWINLLGDHPELIINPDWMKYAGSQDHPWFTHCLAILRETKQLEGILEQSLKQEEGSFIAIVHAIYNFEESREDQHYSLQARSDNTRIKKTYTVQTLVPEWMRR